MLILYDPRFNTAQRVINGLGTAGIYFSDHIIFYNAEVA
jgi:hypothetical protein